ncbi:MAG: polysaccharide deacetylase family protein [Planctomycetes bacterium]|nr:polysaccharide deacetylase family protein [Planctomycetota bacterium]
MPETLADVDATLRFPQLPSALMSRRRRLWHRCVLRAISPLRLLGPTNQNAFGILTYHRVADGVGPDPAMLNVSPTLFRKQITGLLRLGYRPLPLRTLIEQRENQQRLSSHTFAIVFDDGFYDVYRKAWPILREFAVPATVFLATRYLDSHDRFPFDDWSQDDVETARPLSTLECREMLDSGLIELGSHTHSHEDFRDRPVAFRADLKESVDTLKANFQIASPTFSFPYGFTSPELTDIVRDLGLLCALTADCQLVTANDDPFQWGRFGATNLDTASSLAAKLGGWYSTCQNQWRRARSR